MIANCPPLLIFFDYSTGISNRNYIVIQKGTIHIYFAVIPEINIVAIIHIKWCGNPTLSLKFRMISAFAMALSINKSYVIALRGSMISLCIIKSKKRRLKTMEVQSLQPSIQNIPK